MLKYHINTKEKIKLCEESKIRLIDLYKFDLENDCSGLINKLNKYGIDINLDKVV
jgi:hypothetical protein